jgi:hypothetical protein
MNSKVSVPKEEKVVDLSKNFIIEPEITPDKKNNEVTIADEDIGGTESDLVDPRKPKLNTQE